MPYAWFNALDAVLFAFLAAAAASRIQCGSSASSSSGGMRRAPVMLIVLLVYSLSRSCALFLIALDKVPTDQDFAQNSLNSVPATFYALFQTALVWRWVKAVADLTAVLEDATFGSGDVVRFSSLILGIIQPIVCLFAFVDIDCVKFTSLTANDWNLLMQLYGGFLYMYNGISFLLLGFLLLQLWQVSLSGDARAFQRFRVLGIAVVFASVTFFRGLMLVLFLFKNSDKHVANLVQSSWGAPTVLFAEWWSIVICIFVLPVVGIKKEEQQRRSSDKFAGSTNADGDGLSLLTPRRGNSFGSREHVPTQ